MHHDRHHDPSAGDGIKRSLEGGAAIYALEHASRGTLIGQEGGIAAQAARSGGNFVVAAALWHFLIAPYLVVTGVLFGVPSLILAFIAGGDHSATLWRIDAFVFAVSFCLWVRYALYKWLWKNFVRPVDRSLSGRSASATRPNGNQNSIQDAVPAPTAVQDPRGYAQWAEQQQGQCQEQRQDRRTVPESRWIETTYGRRQVVEEQNPRKALMAQMEALLGELDKAEHNGPSEPSRFSEAEKATIRLEAQKALLEAKRLEAHLDAQGELRDGYSH